MRLLNIALLYIFLVANIVSQDITVMTYNIRLDVASDGENAWPLRKDFVKDHILYNAPDVLGTQEGLPQQILYLRNNLSNYKLIGEGRDGGDAGEYSGIFYNLQKFKIDTSGTFWLSETPKVVSQGWDGACRRVCTYGLFVNRISGNRFWVFNTHLDHKGPLARTNGSKLIVDKIKSLNTERLPVVIMGDLNATPDDEIIKHFTQDYNDAYEHSISPPFGAEGTYNGFKHGEIPKRRIDYILVSKNVKVSKYASLTDSKDLKYPSDHFAVKANIRMKSNPIVIGHRGAMGHETENSLASVQVALDHEVEMIEIDVFKIKTGELVVFHDGHMQRLAGVDRKIEDLSMDEIKDIRIVGDHAIPQLHEVIELIDKKAVLNIELKGANTAWPSYNIVTQYVEEKGWSWDDFIITSFKHDELKKMRGFSDDIPIGILPLGDPLDALPLAKEIRAVSMNPNYRALNNEVVDMLHDAGLKVYPYTVNEKEDIDKVKSYGVDGIITNYPESVK